MRFTDKRGLRIFNISLAMFPIISYKLVITAVEYTNEQIGPVRAFNDLNILEAATFKSFKLSCQWTKRMSPRKFRKDSSSLDGKEVQKVGKMMKGEDQECQWSPSCGQWGARKAQADALVPGSTMDKMVELHGQDPERRVDPHDVLGSPAAAPYRATSLHQGKRQPECSCGHKWRSAFTTPQTQVYCNAFMPRKPLCHIKGSVGRHHHPKPSTKDNSGEHIERLSCPLISNKANVPFVGKEFWCHFL